MEQNERKAVIDDLEYALGEAKKGNIDHIVIAFAGDGDEVDCHTAAHGMPLMLLGLTQALSHEVNRECAWKVSEGE